MLKFDAVKKVFPDGTTGLDEVSFEIADGEFVFLTGPSGSGKTTIMRLITKEHAPSQGEIYFKDAPLSTLKNSQIPAHRRQVGVVFQDYQLLGDLKAWENIALALEIAGLPPKEISERVSDLLTLVKLQDKAFLFPKQLSGGEAQRISIARALAGAPALIFADEPTGNLDEDTSIDIIRLLKKINELGTTVMIATHDIGVLKEFENARRIEIKRAQPTKEQPSTPPAMTKPQKVAKPIKATKEAPATEQVSDQKASATPKTELKTAAEPKTPVADKSKDLPTKPTDKSGFSLFGFKLAKNPKAKEKTVVKETVKTDKQAAAPEKTPVTAAVEEL